MRQSVPPGVCAMQECGARSPGGRGTWSVDPTTTPVAQTALRVADACEGSSAMPAMDREFRSWNVADPVIRTWYLTGLVGGRA